MLFEPNTYCYVYRQQHSCELLLFISCRTVKQEKVTFWLYLVRKAEREETLLLVDVQHFITLNMCIDKCLLYLGVRNSEPDVRLRVCGLTDYASNILMRFYIYMHKRSVRWGLHSLGL